MKKKIHTLKELQIEKQKLKLKMEVTKYAFTKGLHTSQQEARNFIWSKISLPATLVGLTAAGVKYFMAASDHQENGQEYAQAEQGYEAESNTPHWTAHLVPLIASLVESFLENGEEEEEELEVVADA